MMTWTAPMAVVEQFVSSEYIAACGDSGETITSYLFNCDAGWTYTDVNDKGYATAGYPDKNSHKGFIFLENGLQAGLQVEGANADTQYGLYNACNIAHESETPGAFVDGYYLPYVGGDGYSEDFSYPVFVWKGESGDSCHCTARLGNVTTPWYTAKS